jgi:hypothetical protein
MKKQSRRKFIASAVALTAGVAVSANSFTTMETKDKKQLAHHVFFWLKNPGSTEDLKKLLDGLRSLEKIESIRALHIGVPAKTEVRPVIDASYSASELMLFDDLDGQLIYQEHPIHKKFVADCSHLWEKVLVYDAMDV